MHLLLSDVQLLSTHNTNTFDTTSTQLVYGTCDIKIYISTQQNTIAVFHLSRFGRRL